MLLADQMAKPCDLADQKLCFFRFTESSRKRHSFERQAPDIEKMVVDSMGYNKTARQNPVYVQLVDQNVTYFK